VNKTTVRSFSRPSKKPGAANADLAAYRPSQSDQSLNKFN